MFAQNGYFWSKAEKVSIAIESCIFELVQVPILNFWTKFPQNVYFQSKAEKVNITTEFYILV